MPKRAKKKKLSDEEKKQMFEAWKASEEYAQIMTFYAARRKNEEINNVDNGTTDISEDWTEVLSEFYKTGEKMKVPKRKAKSKYPN